MLSFSSDMSVPKDVTAVGLYIRSKSGTVLYNSVVEAEVDATGRRTVRFPSTFAILSNGSAASVRVQLIAYGPNKSGNRKALVMRDSTAGVPTDRLGLLRMPLLWINQGSVVSKQGATPSSASTGLSPLSADPLAPRISTLADEAQAGIPDTGYPGACAEGQTYIGGECRSSELVEVEEFTEESNPDNPKGTCFSVEKCFAEPTLLRYDASGIVDIGAVDPKTVNLALITSDGFGIKLPDGRFAISLSANSPFEGYTISNGKIKLSPGPLKVLQNGAATALIATAACEPKSDAVGNCGEWNQKENTIAPKPNAPPAPFPDAGLADASGPFDGGPGDAGPFPDAGPFDGGPPDGGPGPDGGGVGRGTPVSSGEPRVMGLAKAGNIVHFLRNGNGVGGFEASIVKVDAQNGLGTSAPEGLSNTIIQGDGYHIDDVTFGNYGGVSYKNRRSLFITNQVLNLAYNYDPAGGTSPNPITLPAAFTPHVFFASDGVPTEGGPLLFGASAGQATAVFYLNNTTYTSATLTGLLANEIIVTGAVKAPPNIYFVGTTAGRLLECEKVIYPSAVVNCVSKGSVTQGIISDLVYNNGNVYMLVSNPTGSEQTYEGIYRYNGVTVDPLVTRASPQGSNLHFEPYGALVRNRVAATTSNVYFTIKKYGGNKSSVMAVPVSGGTASVVATGADSARDVLVDATHVYYTDYGDGTAINNGGVFRFPQ